MNLREHDISYQIIGHHVFQVSFSQNLHTLTGPKNRRTAKDRPKYGHNDEVF